MKDVIKDELKLQLVDTLPESMDYAQRADERNSLLTNGISNTSSSNRSTFRAYNNNWIATWDLNNKNSTIGNASGRNTARDNKANVSNGRGFRKFSPAEYEDRKVKGLCYGCDELFTPGNRCANKKLLVLLMEE